MATCALVLTAVVALVLSVIDRQTHRLPDAIIGPALAASLACFAVTDLPRLAVAAAGGVTLAGLYGLLWAVARGGFGLGDVKLAALLGLTAGWVGPAAVWWTGVLPFVFGGMAAVFLLATGAAYRSSHLAFGPHMAAAWLLALAFSPG
ncbi:MAG: A24 family peptidase [Cellulomonadaceae bacterium]|jgi:leader peptidase (prepilin peptidase)/N-methyltransferase|nr:A24 family peptidase [Cellulomonadaceae bacterium]